MPSSQEQNFKYIYVIEENIEKAIRDERKKSIIKEYLLLLLEDVNIEKDDEKNLKSNQNKTEKVHNYSLVNEYFSLQGIIQINKKQMEELREEIDNLTIQSITDQESFRIQEAEKLEHRKTFAKINENRTAEELDAVIKEGATIEQDIQNQITLALATKDTRVNEIKGNLQRQVIERNSDYVKAQNENKGLRKKLEELKAELEYNEHKTNHKSNVMYFKSPNLGQETYIPKNASAPSDYQNNNRSYTNIQRWDQKPEECMNGKVYEEVNDEYDQFKGVFNNIDTLKQRSAHLKPNPCSLVTNSSGLQSDPYKNNVTNQGSNSLQAQPKSTEIDNYYFQTDYSKVLDKSNAPGKLPTVYLGNSARKRVRLEEINY